MDSPIMVNPQRPAPSQQPKRIRTPLENGGSASSARTRAESSHARGAA